MDKLRGVKASRMKLSCNLSYIWPYCEYTSPTWPIVWSYECMHEINELLESWLYIYFLYWILDVLTQYDPWMQNMRCIHVCDIMSMVMKTFWIKCLLW